MNIFCNSCSGRYFNEDLDPIWDGRALCFNNWMDPITKVKGYESEARGACQSMEGTDFWSQKINDI